VGAGDIEAAKIHAGTLAAVPWLSVIVPAFREAEHIARSAEAIRGALEATGRSWELLVVDNASPDGTAEALAPLAAADPRVQVLRNDVNRGKGYSVRRGMLAATGHLRLHCDADCAPSFASLPKLLRLLEQGADVAVGSRLADGAQLGRRQARRRRIVGRAFQELCRAALGEPCRDLYCGFKLWRAEPAREAYSRSQLDGWVFDAEVLALARTLGYRVVETGIVWTDRPGSRLSMAHVLVPAVRDLARARSHVRAVARQVEAGIRPLADLA
jgi:glycosyltransferase involved in cell wall biosynthesis